MNAEIKYSADKLKQFGKVVLIQAGLKEEDAEICIDCLVTADMRGTRSHGITHLKDICDRIEAGTIKPDAKIRIEQTGASVFRMDADEAPGMVSAMAAMKKAMELAKETGIGFGTVCKANTYGMGAYYPAYAASHDMIGFCICNTKAYAAPIGGAEPKLGTNPTTIAIPMGRYPDVILDMATTEAAVNKINLAKKEGRSIPDTWAIGPDGERTTDPSLASQGALLPFGGYKGYSLEVIISLLAFSLAGGDLDCNIPKAWIEVNSHCNFGSIVGAIDISRFRPIETFKAQADLFYEYLKSGKLAPGASEILLPGEHSHRKMQQALAEGIEISEPVKADLEVLSSRYSVPWFWENY